MYISKMIFMERDEFDEDFYNQLRENCVINETDYGTTEIMSDSIKNLLSNNENFEYFDKMSKLEVRECLDQNLGSDVVSAMANDEIDFILIVY